MQIYTKSQHNADYFREQNRRNMFETIQLRRARRENFEQRRGCDSTDRRLERRLHPHCAGAISTLMKAHTKRQRNSNEVL